MRYTKGWDGEGRILEHEYPPSRAKGHCNRTKPGIIRIALLVNRHLRMFAVRLNHTQTQAMPAVRGESAAQDL